MAIMDLKFESGDFTNQDIASLSDRPSTDGLTAAQLKAKFDNIGKNMVALGNFNDLIDALQDDTDGDSGADNIAVTTITGAAGTTVQGVLETIAADNFVTTAKIADGQVTLQKMAANSVDSDQYVDGSIDTAHYAAGSVDATALASDAVITAKILNANVTNEKLANLARGSIKVGGADNLVTDLNAKTSGAILVGDGTDLKSVLMIGDATFASTGTITIADDAVTNAKLANISQGSVKVGGASNAPTDLDASGDGKILIGDGTDINSVSVSGDITIDNAGAVTIANKAVTLAKMNDMATASLLGRKTAGTGVPEVLSKSDALTLLNVEDGANAYVHPTTNGNKHIPTDGAANQFLKYASAGTAQWAAHGLVGSDLPLTGYSEAATNAQIASTDTVNEAFGKIQKQSNDLDTSIGDQAYTEQNYITDSESITDSLDVLDMALNDTDDAVAVIDTRVDTIELQTATQQKELNDIERLVALMNPNQSERVDITDAGQTVALPKTAGIGPVKPTIKGLTATNLITNGDFADGTTGWTGSGATLSESDGDLIVTGVGTDATPNGFQYFSAVQNNKYFVWVKARVTNSSCAGILFDAQERQGTTFVRVAQNTIKSSPTINEWYTAGVVITSSNNADYNNFRFIIAHAYADAATATGKVMEIQGGSEGVRVINLTAIFGAGSEPDAATCALLFPTYFDGAQSAIAPRLRSANSGATETSALYTEPLTLRSNATHQDTITPTDGKMVYQKRIDESTYATLSPLPAPVEVATSGVLQSYPSGTIYAEHALADAGIYSTSIGVVNANFPIESLESLYIVDPLTGVLTELDESTVVVAGDGLSFTHAGLTSGDIVFFTYFYAFSGVWGQNVYSHFDGAIVKKDLANNKFYKLGWTVTNGVVTMTATEVT